MISYFILILTLLLAVFHWLAVFKSWRTTQRVTAPLTILGLLGWLAIVSTTQGLSLTGPSLVWFIIALLISLVSSFFNGSPPNSIYFMIGVILHIAAQIGYIIGLNPFYPEFPMPKIIMAFLIMIPLLQTGKTMVCEIHRKKQDFFIPLALLFLVTCFGLLFSGISTLIEGEWWADIDAYLVSSGVILLFLNDIFFTFNFWVRPLSKVGIKTALTFYSGTILLTVGAVLHLIKPI